ncbi:Ubiquitin-conjugating enzyme E2 6 [Golovinomyces cichoracearum]|uniref:Ubiquitin-conjugating enzyme E2 6 n=1 Tax=Golovinomyces cichoracearum TaxID=62708 RepID=A0A420IZR2_9PEZI|nr:Ubiquitin-conjugating enzyme E2 6 [Golovinomyces cichoracearum]
MASRAANKRQLTREYKSISQSPPPYITAHPSETNILEWHYIITGPPDTPYHGGQYWGTLIFPPNYPFAPPAIRMHTPSGRFQPSTRLCLSISDFHPKSFNPAWEVSTILIGLLSFMTSEEMTTGSVSSTEAERKWAARRTIWWNSTGGGSWKDANIAQKGKGNVKAGDGGLKFRTEWPVLDQENWKWIKENNIDPTTGKRIEDSSKSAILDAPGATKLKSSEKQDVAGVALKSNKTGGSERNWIGRNKLFITGCIIFTYVLIARLIKI